MQKYGYFSEDNREFIITRPDTPAPWVNYISNGRYNGLVSNTGGGFSFYRSPKDSRITRWRYNSLPIDRPGRYIYFRDRETGEYWSPTWQPTFTKLDKYACHHGQYYTRIESAAHGCSHEVLYFVPEDDDLEIWRVQLKNESRKKRTFDIFGFVELCLGHALVDLINQPNDQHFNDVFFDKGEEILFASKRYWVRYSGATVKQANEAWDRQVFFASTLPVKGFDGSKNEFIGRWRSEENPQVLEEGKCRNTAITAGDAVAVLQNEVTLAPGEDIEFSLMLGVVPRSDYKNEATRVVKKYRSENVVEQAYFNLRNHWSDYLSHVQIETPDDDMNRMINVWNQYQTSVTFLFSRDASYYHGGLLFGRGYRDSCQDIMGPVMPRPQWVKKRITEMAGYQFKEGKVFHLYFPLTGGGEQTGHTDTPLWLPLSIMVYLKETGDFAFLEEKVRYYDEDDATIFGHLCAAIDYTIRNLSDRGLAKFGPGDWNDTLDYLGRGGKGESVWVTMYLCYILRETIALCQAIGNEKTEKRYRKEYDRIREAINTHCWDGEWYTRGTNDLGDVIGSSKNEEGKIFLNVQTWAVISGVAQGERAQKCLDAVVAHLETPKGPKILHPAYTKINDNIGLATRCVPGKKENGAVFNHPVSWAVLAECVYGRGDRAFEIYKKALPMNPVIDIDRYEVEPYVYAEYVTSPDHPTYGQASHSWLTGSSTWMLRDATDHICGIRPTYHGLLVDPCIPKEWKSYRVRRKYRGTTYNFSIENPHGLSKGRVEIEIDGTALNGPLIDLRDKSVAKLLAGKESVKVKCVLQK